MSGYQIECTSLSKTYNRNGQIIKAVDDINLGIGTGEMVVLTGRSGAGKSTLLNLMSGLIKPSSGKVMIENKHVAGLSNSALSELLLNRIGIIFQSFNLLPTYTVFENIEIALVPKGLKRGRSNDNIMSLLELFELKNKEHLLPAELSVGQQQKVAIIRTLIKKPSIIFADEPTGSVDGETADGIMNHLLNLKKEEHFTLVLATHSDKFENLADNVYKIENGRIHY